MKTYQSTNSGYAKSLDTRALRKQFLVQEIFSADELVLNYSHTDRILIGGAMPVAGDVRIGEELAKMVGTDYLLKRRELGAINIGGDGSVCIDGESLRVAANEGIYIGCGNRDVRFSSDDAQAPAKFYINCAPAHTEYPSRTITQQQASPETLGSTKTSNARTIYKYIVPDVLPTCQLLMGLTRLETGSLWNTMPCHRHERRMEVYFYFDMDEDSVVFHFMGEPSETRHLVVRNEEAVIAPSWSLHTGVGTSKYTFIWGMVGENQEFSDMDFVAMSELL